MSFKSGLGIILALSFLSGCSNKSAEHHSAPNSNAKPVEIKTTVIKEPAKEEEEGVVVDALDPPMGTNLPCKSEDDCALVPNGDCYGCLKPNGSHFVTTQAHASKLWMEKRAECEPKLRKVSSSKEPPKKEEMSQRSKLQSF